MHRQTGYCETVLGAKQIEHLFRCCQQKGKRGIERNSVQPITESKERRRFERVVGEDANANAELSYFWLRIGANVDFAPRT